MSTQRFSISDLMDVLVRLAGLPQEARSGDANHTFSDVGLDSLAFLQLQAELQGRYGFELPDDRPQAYTFGDIVALVNERLAERSVA
jgi:minimal PKS acyl carrier protein